VGAAEQRHDRERPRARRRRRRQLAQPAQRHQGRRAGPGAVRARDEGPVPGPVRHRDVRQLGRLLGLCCRRRHHVRRRRCDGAARRAPAGSRDRVLDLGGRGRHPRLFELHLADQARVHVRRHVCRAPDLRFESKRDGESGLLHLRQRRGQGRGPAAEQQGLHRHLCRRRVRAAACRWRRFWAQKAVGAAAASRGPVGPKVHRRRRTALVAPDRPGDGSPADAAAGRHHRCDPRPGAPRGRAEHGGALRQLAVHPDRGAELRRVVALCQQRLVQPGGRRRGHRSGLDAAHGVPVVQGGRAGVADGRRDVRSSFEVWEFFF